MKHLQQAILFSLTHHRRSVYRLAAVGVRADGVVVQSRNGCIFHQRIPRAHAEARLARKLTPGSVVYVARTLKDGTVAMAKPCVSCQNCLRHRGVDRVYYTIAYNEYGVLKL